MKEGQLHATVNPQESQQAPKEGATESTQDQTDMHSKPASSADVAGPKIQQYDVYKQPTGDLLYQTSSGQEPNSVDASVQDATANDFKTVQQPALSPAPTAPITIVPQNIQTQLTATLPLVAHVNLQPIAQPVQPNNVRQP